jgi:hypothetical protein
VGSSATSYTTPPVTAADNGAKYKVFIAVPGANETSTEATLTVRSDTTPPVPSAGALVNTNGTTVDLGVGFDEPVEDASAGTQANYTVSGGTVTSFTYYPASKSALFKVTGLAAGGSGVVTVKNVKDVKGNAITSVDVPFTVSSKLKWNVVGAAELGTGNWVVPVAANGFDIFSDGMTEWATYDETTFVYEEVTGDFDKKLRVEYQDNSSQWARAGLIVRDVGNFGVGRDAQGAGAAGRYQKCHVNPVGPTLTGPGTAGNGAWEGNRRLVTGGETTSVGGGGAPVPYPNAWCRIKRTGNAFEIFRSEDATTWISMGTTTFDPPMPATLLVGPEFSPENGNITNEADRKTWVAKIRDYGDVGGGAPPTLSAGKDATGKVVLTFQGTLQSADEAAGPYTDTTATSPATIDPAGAKKFYRAKN